MDAVEPNRVALSRELSEFLVELSVALHKHSMYPGATPRSPRLLSSRVAPRTARRSTDDRLRRRPAATDHRRRDHRSRSAGAAAPGRRAAPPSPRRRQPVARGSKSPRVGDALRALSSEPERDGPLGLAREDACATGRISSCIRSRSTAWRSSATGGAASAEAGVGRARNCGSAWRARRWRPATAPKQRDAVSAEPAGRGQGDR